MTNLLCKTIVLGTCLIGTSLATAAATVYKWTDADGIVHFSDVPPVNAPQESTEQIIFDDFEPVNLEETGYSIIEQAQQISEMRRQETEARLVARQLQLEAQRLANEVEISRMQQEQAPTVVHQVSPLYSYSVPYLYQNRYGQPRGYRNHRPREFIPSTNINRASFYSVTRDRGSRPHRGRDLRPSF